MGQNANLKLSDRLCREFGEVLVYPFPKFRRNRALNS